MTGPFEVVICLRNPLPLGAGGPFVLMHLRLGFYFLFFYWLRAKSRATALILEGWRERRLEFWFGGLVLDGPDMEV